MEALGAAASIIQVAAVGLALAQALYKFCDEASSSNEQVKDLAFYVRSTSLVLEEIGKVFQEEDQGSRPMISQDAIVTVKEIVQKCAGTFNDLQEIVDDAEQSSLGVLKFSIKASRLKVVQFGLGEMRSNLQCMMQVIIYARLKAEPRSIFDESEQRRLIAELIAQQLRCAEEYNQTESHHAADDNSQRISPTAENIPSQPSISASQLPSTNNSNGAVSPVKPPKESPPSIKDPGPYSTKTQSPERHTSQEQPRPPSISTSTPTTKPKASTVYLHALSIVCCPCFICLSCFGRSRRGKSAPSAASAALPYNDGFELRLDPPAPPDPRREGHAVSIAELGEESEVDRLVRLWTTLYN
ncbi:hypothetical protein ASPSYDRAFT_86955 [Aspergillus sydowii CBS 593.65]|uniref:Fungal N-terminal domain-containing protein n=1 Tax=Aspergillus sydowii CBS 593.65 TaxID=1036612 RepID=A0A1L9TM46_9EURO|nr:uncharacterized protein ASPSYDRAFT_86955 [Aspergillus sydowii CBS 593.65]OJJ60363.1 hypothetical protein ASPSYDRAFT_86955 [Aspergillus sydowii CBS 593.65]